MLQLSASRDAVDNRGEDLRFPISSSSGFSSPMRGFAQAAPKDYDPPGLVWGGFLLYLSSGFRVLC